MKRVLLPLGCAWVLSGCGGALVGETAGLDRVGTYSAARPRPLPATTWAQVGQVYQRLATDGQDRLLRATAQQRLADLLLERGELYWLYRGEQVGRLPESAGRTGYLAYRKATEYYEAILREYPARRGNDRVMYQLARAYDLAGELKQEMEVLDRLVREFSQSVYVEEAQFRRGELLYATGDYAGAERAYQNTLRRGKKGPYYRTALYKQGWAQFKQGRHEASLETFATVLDMLGVGADLQRLASTDQEMAQDALRTISLAMMRQPGSVEKEQALRQYAGRPYFYLLVQGLAQALAQQRRYAEAAETYAAFARLQPDHPQAPSALLHAIEVLEPGAQGVQGLALRAELATRYAPDAHYWRQRSPAEWARLKPEVQAVMRDLARHYHAEAQQTWRAATWGEAVRWYRAYLKGFPAEMDTVEMHLRLADCLYDAGDYAAAVPEYERVAYAYPPHALRAEAAYAGMQVLSKRFDLAAPRRREALIAAISRFVTEFPNDERRVAVTAQLALERFNAKDYVGAIATARDVLRKVSGDDNARAAAMWNLIGQAQMESGDYKAAEQSVAQALALDRDVGAPGSEQTRLAAAIYRQGEAAQRAGRWQEAAGHFLRVSAQAPEIYLPARFDAAVCLTESGQTAKARALFEEVLSLRPAVELAQRARWQLAKLYAAASDWPAEGAVSESYAEHTNDVAQQREWLWRAAQAYQRAGVVPRAIGLYRQLLARGPGEVSAEMGVRYQLALLYRGQHDEAREQEQLLAIVGLRERAPRGAAALPLARAAYDLGYRVLGDYRGVALREPLAESLRRKKALLESALRYFDMAGEPGIFEVTTAATYQTAWMFEDLANAIKTSEAPRQLDEEEAEVYRNLLEEQAMPFTAKAIALYELNMERATPKRRDSWITQSLHALARLRPTAYASLVDQAAPEGE